MNKFLLSTFLVKVKDNNKNDQILSRFNGTDDFKLFFQSFLDDIFENIQSVSESRDQTKRHLTLDSPPIIDEDSRSIYGFFSCGISGDKYKIKDIDTQANLLDVETNHAAYRNLFFYISIPRERDCAALILQRKSNFGIKGLFNKALNTFLRGQGYSIYRVEINNVLHGSVYQRMITHGNLKKIDFIKRRLPATIEDYYQNNGNLTQIPGVLKTTMISTSGLPSRYRQLVDRLFRDSNRDRIEIPGIDEEFDEVEFELELNGKKKNFYIANRHKIQPDVDVASELEFDITGQPTLNSLLLQARDLITDVIDIDPEDVVQN